MSENCGDCKYKTELLNLSHETISKIAARAETAERQVEDLQRGFQVIALMQMENHSLRDAQKVAAMALKLKCECVDKKKI